MPKRIKTGFGIFMEEYQNEHVLDGGKRMPLEKVKVLTSPLWNALTPQQKAAYNDKAKALRKGEEFKGAKQASDGTLISENLALEAAMEEKEKLLDLLLREYVNQNQDDPENFKATFPNRQHYIIVFNVFCTYNDLYVPAEVAVIEYTVRRGITAKYHKIIDPGRLPLGCAGQAKAHSQETHDLLFAEVEKESDYEKIWKDILSFIAYEGDPTDLENIPPIFTMGNMIEQTVGCLHWLAEKADAKSADFFRIWKLENFLYDIRLALNQPIISKFIGRELLTKSTFDYQLKTRCDFHEERDSKYCARGIAERLCFLLSDSVCGCFDIEITSNHIPNRAEEVKAYQVQYGRHTSNFVRDFVPRPNRNFARHSGADESEHGQQAVAGIGRGLASYRLDVNYNDLTRGIGRGRPQ